MKENELWYGYLEAGPKSTAVLLDRQLETGNPKTMYLFNLSKGEILEYSREVAEPKLRALTSVEVELVERLTAAYGMARAEFRPRGVRAASIQERRRSRWRPRRMTPSSMSKRNPKTTWATMSRVATTTPEGHTCRHAFAPGPGIPCYCPVSRPRGYL